MSELLFEYKVRAKHKLGFKEFSFYATTEIEEFLNRNNIEYVRNMTDTVENRLFKENKRLENIIKEVREYIEENQEEHKYTDRCGFTYTEGHFLRDSETLLEILDDEKV